MGGGSSLQSVAGLGFRLRSGVGDVAVLLILLPTAQTGCSGCGQPNSRMAQLDPKASVHRDSKVLPAFPLLGNILS